MHVASGDRRFFVVRVSEAREGQVDHFNRLYVAFNDDEMAWHYLTFRLRRDTSGFHSAHMPYIHSREAGASRSSEIGLAKVCPSDIWDQNGIGADCLSQTRRLRSQLRREELLLTGAE